MAKAAVAKAVDFFVVVFLNIKAKNVVLNYMQHY